jgi:hypothetical protein
MRCGPAWESARGSIDHDTDNDNDNEDLDSSARISRFKQAI